MESSRKIIGKLQQEVTSLRQSLAEVQEKLQSAEAILGAIHSGEVDAVVVSTPQGQRVFTLQGVDYIYQLLVEQMAEGAITVSGEGMILYCNRRFSELLNYPLEKLIGSSLEMFIVPRDRRTLSQLLAQTSTQENLSQELSLIALENNQETPVKLSFKKINVDGLLINSIVVTDITEYKLKEAAKLTQVLKQAIATIVRYRAFPNQTWEFDYWSEGCELLLGYTAAELMADPTLWASRVDPEDLERIVAQTFADFKQHKENSSVEYRFRHKNGTERWLADTPFSEWDESNGCWNVNTILTDITERKQAEQKTVEQASLINLATDAIFVTDLGDQILFWNQGAERLYGWTETEVLGNKTQALFNFDHKLDQPLQITLQTGSWEEELEQITKTGQKILVMSRRTLVKDLFNQPQSILIVNSDVTEKEQLRKQFYHAQRLESLGVLASGIAHDFNNILTPILGVSQLLPLKLPARDEQTQRLLVMLANSTERAINLVKQILFFGRATEGEHVTLQLGYLVQEVISIAKQTFPKSIEILVQIPVKELWTIRADSTQMNQVFMNLLVNARDAMPNGGQLTIRAENRQWEEQDTLNHLETKAGSYVAVMVADTGVGMSPQLLEKIFDPFFTTKEVGQGTGLGLSTVMGIVKNHGGFVQVDSQVGKGSQFEVFLPATQEEITSIITESEMPLGQGELILIVDDEAPVREITKASLEQYHYRTLTANDGMEALATYAEYQQEISVVIIDMMMPNLNGETAIRTLKNINPQVKIIATSGLLENHELALKADVKNFLLKPYNVEPLLQMLRKIIPPREESFSASSPISFPSEEPELCQEDLAQMSPDWLQQMYDAAYCFDADIMLDLIDQMPTDHQAIATKLRELVLNFQTESIMTVAGSLLETTI